ncbi:MAG TPA: HEAT repeat domain-containing protein [Labilithrix sp.]|jgi:HEAT repeat protein
MSDLAADVRARLHDGEPEVRRRATHELPKLAAPDSYDLLVVALGDEDWRVRKEAATVAARVEPRTAVVFAIARVLGERDAIGLRNAAVEALVGIGPDAVPGAVDALGRLDADGRKLAVEVLAGAPTLAGMRALVRTLDDPDPNVVVAAADGLGKAHLAGDEARELASGALVKLLENGATLARLAALEALRALEEQVPWSALEPMLGDPLLKRPAIAAAGGSRTPRALLALAEACADPSATVSRDAVVALGRSIEEAWGEDELLDVAAKTLRASQGAHERLRALAKDASDSIARGAAILALGLVRDPDDVSVLADALADDAVAERAEASLHLFGQDAVEPLLDAGRRTQKPSLRGATISMLPSLVRASGASPPKESEPLAAVREALADASAEVVVPALKSIAIVGGAQDVEPVARLVASADPKISSAAQAALLAIAQRHTAAARAYVSTTIDPRGDGALAATIVLDALARAGAAAPTDAAFLASALTHREAAVRRSSIDALASVGAAFAPPPVSARTAAVAGSAPPSSVAGEAADAVSLSLADEEPVVVHAAIRALGRLGRAEQLAQLAASTRDPIRLAQVLRALKDADPERAFAAARPLLRSPEPAVAAAAIEAASAIDFERRVEALMSAADHADHEVVKLALAQLANVLREKGDDRALAALARAIDHPDEPVRRYAAELLGHEGGSDAESLLRARLDRERSADVRRAIMEALAARGPT